MLLIHRPEPPWAYLAPHAARFLLRLSGTMAAPPWPAAAMAHAMDVAALAENRKRFNDDKPGGGTAKLEVAAPKAKAKAAAK